ncbi:tRNA dimethylallyltransferase 1 [Bacteroidia bacterium]|nr:tRNA dimethylallyltransferase 1 [Bacteroidia bacterium]GHT51995.1 tRNA dimethylallyltransferase 1 [Bacteroidia bacterium]
MKTLIVLLGPTGVGKTELSLRLAEKFNAPVISADSRQFYKDLIIGTAAPTAAELQRAKHYFVGNLELADYYSASQFEEDVIRLLSELYETQDTAIMSGGSMMYIDAVCKGIDEIPTIDETLRAEIGVLFEKEGLEPIRQQLKLLDPVFYNQVDLQNHKRVIHALEICLMSGRPYSSLRTNSVKERPFRIIKIGLTRDREELYDRINRRVDQMMEDGLLEEARKVYPSRHLNSLNTVGYKELFQFLDGEDTLDFAVEKIKQNSRIYSRKQMTWFKRDKEINWFHPDNIKGILKRCSQNGEGL